MVSTRSSLRDIQPAFDGGLNTSSDALHCGPNEVRSAFNCKLTDFQAIQKRLGTQLLNNAALSPNPVRGGFSWLQPGVQQLLAISDGTLFTGSFGFPTAWTPQVGTLHEASYPSFVSFQDASNPAVYIADSDLNKWDGSSLTVGISGATPVSRLTVYNQRLFGCTGNDEFVYWSDLSNGDTLGDPMAGGGSAKVLTYGDQQIITIEAIRSSLFMFHVSGISRFTGISIDDISIQAGTQGISSDVGTVFPRSPVATENSVFFLTDRGFYEASEAGVTPISAKIDNIIRNVDKTGRDRICGVHNRHFREVWWFFEDVGVFVYNYYLKQWTGPLNGAYLTPDPPTAMWEAVDDLSQPVVLVGTSAGYVFQGDRDNTGRDLVDTDGGGGNTIIMSTLLRRFYFGDPATTKALRWIYVTVDTEGSSLCSISWKIGSTVGTTTLAPSDQPIWGLVTWGAFTWGSGVDSEEQRVAAGGNGKFLDVTFSDSSDDRVTLSAVEAAAYDYKRRF